MRSPVDGIIEENYDPVFRYCISRMDGDIHAAEDCTQEVFLLMYRNIHQLNLTKSILPWLFRTADHVMQAYRRKNPAHDNIDEIAELIDESTFQDSVFDVLDEEEKRLVQSYYGGEAKEIIARKRGITLTSLYKQISRIKQKLLRYLSEQHN